MENNIWKFLKQMSLSVTWSFDQGYNNITRVWSNTFTKNRLLLQFSTVGRKIWGLKHMIRIFYLQRYMWIIMNHLKLLLYNLLVFHESWRNSSFEINFEQKFLGRHPISVRTLFISCRIPRSFNDFWSLQN